MNYFKPSDIRTVHCTVQTVLNSGSAFAVTTDDEAVYIPGGIAQRAGIDIGDALVCYCIDQHLDEARRPDVSARYKAVRLKIEQRFSDVIPGSAMIDMVEKAKEEPALVREITLEESRTVISGCLKQKRAWLVDDLLGEVRASEPSAVMSDQMRERIALWMEKLHAEGIIAACSIRSKQDAKPVVFYAEKIDIFTALLDGYEVDE